MLYEDAGMNSISSGSFVQALSCPPVGASKVTASGTKLIPMSEDYCGIFIQTSAGDLIPYARSYSGNDFEASPGPMAIHSDSIICSVADCNIELSGLEDPLSFYILLSKNGTSSTTGASDVRRKDIARFLGLTTFGPKMSEIDTLDTGSWDDAARALYVREQFDMPKTSHREYFRKRSNTKWDVTTQEARSNHPCSPNSKWRRYSFLPQDQYDTVTGDENMVTFERVPTETDQSAIYEADAEGDVSSHGAGVFEDSTSTSKIGFSGNGYYDFANQSDGDHLEFTINLSEAEAGIQPTPISFRYNIKTGRTNKPCALFINGVLVEETYDFLYTGGPNWWRYSKFIDVTLNPGINLIKIIGVANTSGPRIDHLVVGKPQAVLIKSNGQIRAVAKYGLHILDDFEYEILNDSVIWEDYPYPRLGASGGQYYGRAEILVDGSRKHLDTGNVSAHFAWYVVDLDLT